MADDPMTEQQPDQRIKPIETELRRYTTQPAPWSRQGATTMSTAKREQICKRCGHGKSEHRIISGPNSIGAWAHGICARGGRSIPPYWSGGCGCSHTRFTLLKRTVLAEERNDG